MLITKEFEFSYAHILPNHEGRCSRLHGHNAVLKVTVSGHVRHEDEKASYDGMVIDFGDLKDIVRKTVVDKWDHRFLATGDEWVVQPNVKQLMPNSDQYVTIGYRTTAENLARVAFNMIQRELLDGRFQGKVNVYAVEFWETPTSHARYEGEK